MKFTLTLNIAKPSGDIVLAGDVANALRSMADVFAETLVPDTSGHLNSGSIVIDGVPAATWTVGPEDRSWPTSEALNHVRVGTPK